VPIRRRLIVAFGTILALFAITQGFQFWSAQLRASSMATVDRALKRQLIMASLRHRVQNLQKQVSLLGQVDGAEDMPEARQFFSDEIDHAAADIARLLSLADAQHVSSVKALQDTYRLLADAWRQFYSYLALEPGWAVAFQLRAEPLSRRVLAEQLPALVREQDELSRAAEVRFTAVTRLTQRVSNGIFGLSMLLASVIAYTIARRLTRDLGELRLGASMIGSMNLAHRIPVKANDEIGVVARTFNDMADKLSGAREQLTVANEELVVQNREIERQRQVSETLLRNILPEQIAAELAADGKVAPRYFEEVTILFTDFVGFTLSTEELAAEDLVECLNGYFTAFDQIVTRYGLEKLKTIGDSYMCAGGMPERNASHPVDAVLASFELLAAVAEQGRVHPDAQWAVRIGIHTGPVVAGVVGIKKFAFDVWGDTVNYASRMESSGGPNRINVSAATHRRIKDFFSTEYRGQVVTKDKRNVDMYFVNGIHPALLDGQRDATPPAFVRRYKTYFQKDLVAFPALVV
jgi:class 3 adenylate cyclase/HAMP domain-containing protein